MRTTPSQAWPFHLLRDAQACAYQEAPPNSARGPATHSHPYNTQSPDGHPLEAAQREPPPNTLREHTTLEDATRRPPGSSHLFVHVSRLTAVPIASAPASCASATAAVSLATSYRSASWVGVRTATSSSYATIVGRSSVAASSLRRAETAA
jgi:hypothetical protein